MTAQVARVSSTQTVFFLLGYVQVMEIVRSGGRPSLNGFPDVLPHYKELIKVCWVQEPDDRPSFKQVLYPWETKCLSVTAVS